jgi:hypothetical protein
LAPHNKRPETSPSAPEAATADELIGLTVWRLRPATAKDTRELPRLLVQKKDNKSGEKTDELLAERISPETPIREGEIVRLGIEVPREGASYIYVIDREVYADGSMSDPYLIFPAKTTPRGDEVGGAGKITYVPSRKDPIPCFTLQRSRADQVSELLVIIISPQPLGLSPGDEPLRLDPAQLAKWEREWSGSTERREARGGAGRGWTVKEKEAGEGKRKLVLTDPLPHTIYWVKAGQGEVAMIKLPLRIAQ